MSPDRTPAACLDPSDLEDDGATPLPAAGPASPTASSVAAQPRTRWGRRLRRPTWLAPPTRRVVLWETVPAAGVVVVSAILFVTYSVAQWRTMDVPSWDLAIFSELAKDYAHLQAPIVPVKGDGYNLLGDHFHPILVLLGPVYRLAPSGLTLLVVQDLLLAVSAWPVTRLASRYLSPFGGLAVGLAYALSWGLQGAVAAQFHEISFAVPLLAWASVAFVEQRWKACALWTLPLLLVKEDMGLTVLMIGLALAVRGRQVARREAGRRPTTSGTGQPARRRGLLPTDPVRLGLGLAATGLVAFLVTVLVVLPLLNPDGTWAYGLGSGSADGTELGVLARLFTPSVKVETLTVLVATMGVIGLGSPWAAAVVPTLAWRFLGSVPFYWEWQNWHYNAVLMPVAVGALLDVVARLHERRAAGATAVAAEDAPPTAAPARQLVPRWARATAWAGVLVSVAVLPATARDLPLWAMTEPGFGVPGPRVTSAQQVMASLDPGTSVETDLSLLAYLVPDHTVSWVGTSSTPSHYVVIDRYSSAWGGNAPTDAAQWAESRHPGTSYATVLELDGFEVAQRTS